MTAVTAEVVEIEDLEVKAEVLEIEDLDTDAEELLPVKAEAVGIKADVLEKEKLEDTEAVLSIKAKAEAAETENVQEPVSDALALRPLPQKRPAEEDDSCSAIVPHKVRRHAGMFREQTIGLVLILVERVKKAADLAELQDVLEELTDCVVDETVLLKTGVGKEVAALQKHADVAIAEKAKVLVAQWRRDRETRQKVAANLQEKTQMSLKASRKLEESIFNFACPVGFATADDKKAYQRHFLRIATHLKDGGPGCLLTRLRDGAVPFEEVAFLPDDELLSTAKREKLEADRQAALKEALAATGAEAVGTESSEYMCPRCSSNRCIYKEMQTGWHNDQQDMTILLCCLECGERWKASDDHGLGA